MFITLIKCIVFPVISGDHLILRIMCCLASKNVFQTGNFTFLIKYNPYLSTTEEINILFWMQYK